MLIGEIMKNGTKKMSKGVDVMHHYITKYEEKGVRYAEAWFQINLLGWCFCFFKRKIEI
jgi:hypothetical protein